MSARILALIVLALTTVAMAFLGIMIHADRQGDQARKLDQTTAVPRACCDTVMGCGNLESVTLPTRTPVVGESFEVSMNYRNAQSTSCRTTASLSAAGFDKDPEGPIEAVLSPGPNQVYWTLSARKPGTHTIVVNGDITRGVHVLSNEFLSPATASLLSAILFVLGPMATLPWWIERYRSKKTPKE